VKAGFFQKDFLGFPAIISRVCRLAGYLSQTERVEGNYINILYSVNILHKGASVSVLSLFAFQGPVLKSVKWRWMQNGWSFTAEV